MGNPHHRRVDDALKMQRVRVVVDDVVYEGVLQSRNHNHEKDVLLRGAKRMERDQFPGDPVQVGRVWLQAPDRIEQLDPERVAHVAPDELTPSPYHQRGWDVEANHEYIQQWRNQGHADSLLVARERDDGRLELLEGHKRRWVAQQAGLDSVPVRVVGRSDWQAAWHYADDHLHDLDDETLRATLGVYADEWGTQAREIPVVAEAAEWGGVAITDDGLQDVDADPAPRPEAHVADVSSAVDGEEEPTTDASEAEGGDDSAADGESVLIDGEEVTPPLDYDDRAHLEWVADRVESINQAVEYFDASYSTVRRRLEAHDLRERAAGWTLTDEIADGARRDRHLSSEDTEADGDVVDTVYCGVCGAGPFDSGTELSGHHNGAGHDGSTQPVDDPPTDTKPAVERPGDVGDAERGPTHQGESVATDGHGAAAGAQTDVPTPDNDPPHVLAEHDINPNRLVDALDGANTLLDVQRELNITDREIAVDVVGTLGLLEQLSSGTSGVDRSEAEAAVQEVVERAD